MCGHIPITTVGLGALPEEHVFCLHYVCGWIIVYNLQLVRLSHYYIIILVYSEVVLKNVTFIMLIFLKNIFFVLWFFGGNWWKIKTRYKKKYKFQQQQNLKKYQNSN